jgi:[pyruvate, water dikinase]-phosphate phosphotransferase / [pyruvate, water dikinase] kinase
VQVFFVSDHTGVTVEVLGRSLLARFTGLQATLVTRPFVDDVDKAGRLVAELARCEAPPVVFTSITAPEVLAVVRGAPALVLDVVEPFLGRLAVHLGRDPVAEIGTFHAVRDAARYQARIAAVEFSLATDDGLGAGRYGQAELILVGVSRAGKTPTSLYLAMHHGLFVANYPLTSDDGDDLPPTLTPHVERLYGLSIDPERLQQIRRERRADGDYASLAACRRDVARAERLFRRYELPVVNTTVLSVEEIAARILHGNGGGRASRQREL